MGEDVIIQVRLSEDEIPRDIDRIKRQIEAGLSPDRRHSTNESKERAHQNRLEAIQRQSVAAIQQIEVRKQAQLDVVRQRATQREAEQQRQLEAIHAQSAAKIQAIEARKQAQIDAVRERAVQREIEQQQRLERAAQSSGSFQGFLRRFSSTIREAGESIQQAGFAALGLTGLIVGLGRASVQAAIDIDKQVNVLKALTGSAEQAEKRFAQLVAISQKTPGLTTGLAATLDAQLRTLNVTESTINKVLPAIGRLNAVSPLGDPNRLSQNLVQLVTQNFEKQDLKELVGQSPLAGELIKQIFNVDSPTNAKAIRESAKRLGITTVEEFFDRFAEAAANNPKLQKITESLGTQFEKLRDRIIVALRPLGLTLIQTLQPLVERAVPIIERISKAFAELPEGVRQLIVILGGLAAAIGPVLIAVGAVIQTFGALGNIITAVAGAGGVSALISAFGPFIPVVLAVAAAVGALVTAFVVDFGGIRTVVFDVLNFIETQFGFVKQAFVDNRAEIERFKILFKAFSDEVSPIVKALGEAFKNSFELAVKGAIVVARSALQFFNTQLAITVSTFRTIKNLLVDIANAGVKAADFLFPGLGTAAKQRFGAITQPRASSLTSGLNNDELDPGNALNLLVDDLNRLSELDPRRNRGRRNAGGAGGGSESTQRALREATLRAEQDAQRNEFKLLQDQNERILKENERFFRIGLIQADQFFKDKLGLQQANIGNEINLLNQQLIAAQEAFDKTKPNTVERVRLQQQINDFQTQIIIKTRELGDVEKEVSRESLAAKNQAVEAQKQQLELTDQQSKKELEILAAQREQARTQEAILRAARDPLTERGKDLDRAILETGANLDLKILNAQKEAILENRKADEEAILSMVKNRERLADATIFHADRAQALFLDHLARQKSVTEATADAMIRAYEGVVGSIEKGVDSLTKKLGFFGDIVGGILKAIVRNITAQLLTPIFSGGRGQAGGGGLLGSILGGIFGPGAGGLAGGVFRTPPTFPGGSFNFSSLINLAGGGDRISALPSISSSAPAELQAAVLEQGGSVFNAAGNVGLGALFGNLFKGFGFGLKPGSGTGGLAAAAPLLGLTLGVGAGGQSRLGQILGGVGGAALGIGLTAAPSIFAAGGSLASPAIAGLFSNPITAIAGAGLLVGSILLGKAAQRRKDEEASGQMLTQALNAIQELKAGIASDQIDGNQAGSIFDTQILSPFKQQINTLKTASVRESRLKNQTADLRRVFDDLIPPEVEAQRQRRVSAQRSALIDSRLIPQFASGGISSGGLALLHPNEMVLTPQHQFAVRSIGGPDIFERVGVPGIQPSRVFDNGGIMPSVTPAGPMVINLSVGFGMSRADARQIVASATSDASGQDIIMNVVQNARERGRRV